MRLLTAHKVLLGSAVAVFGANALGALLRCARGDGGAGLAMAGWSLAAAAVVAYWRWIRTRHGAAHGR